MNNINILTRSMIFALKRPNFYGFLLPSSAQISHEIDHMPSLEEGENILYTHISASLPPPCAARPLSHVFRDCTDI